MKNHIYVFDVFGEIINVENIASNPSGLIRGGQLVELVCRGKQPLGLGVSAHGNNLISLL